MIGRMEHERLQNDDEFVFSEERAWRNLNMGEFKIPPLPPELTSEVRLNLAEQGYSVVAIPGLQFPEVIELNAMNGPTVAEEIKKRHPGLVHDKADMNRHRLFWELVKRGVVNSPPQGGHWAAVDSFEGLKGEDIANHDLAGAKRARRDRYYGLPFTRYMAPDIADRDAAMLHDSQKDALRDANFTGSSVVRVPSFYEWMLLHRRKIIKPGTTKEWLWTAIKDIQTDSKGEEILVSSYKYLIINNATGRPRLDKEYGRFRIYRQESSDEIGLPDIAIRPFIVLGSAH